jgi:hypothetical protein
MKRMTLAAREIPNNIGARSDNSRPSLSIGPDLHRACKLQLELPSKVAAGGQGQKFHWIQSFPLSRQMAFAFGFAQRIVFTDKMTLLVDVISQICQYELVKRHAALTGFHDD